MDAQKKASGRRPTTHPKCFLHIPKSGGVSIHAALYAALPAESLSPHRFDQSVFCNFDSFDLLRPELRTQIVATDAEVDALAEYRAVSGHFSLLNLLRVTSASSIVTVLREPRSRLLSLYLYWRDPGLADYWDPYRANEHALRPLRQFLSESCLAPVTDNQVCRMLLHGDPRLPVCGFVSESDVEAIAAEAIERLDSLGYVGALELGDSAWEGLAGVFGVKLNPVTLNVTGQHVTPAVSSPDYVRFTPDVLDMLEERNAADSIVYDYVLAGAGLSARQIHRLKDGALAHQLVKMGDLIGRSATLAAGHVNAVDVLRGELEERDRQLSGMRAEINVQQQALQALGDDARSYALEAARLARWLEAVHMSASWRLTAPFRAITQAVRASVRKTRRLRSMRLQQQFWRSTNRPFGAWPLKRRPHSPRGWGE